MDKHTKYFIAGVTALSLAGAGALYAIKIHPTVSEDKKFLIARNASITIAAVGLSLIIASQIIKTK